MRWRQYSLYRIFEFVIWQQYIIFCNFSQLELLILLMELIALASESTIDGFSNNFLKEKKKKQKKEFLKKTKNYVMLLSSS